MKLKEERDKRGWSMRVMGKVLGINASTVLRWERGGIPELFLAHVVKKLKGRK